MSDVAIVVEHPSVDEAKVMYHHELATARRDAAELYKLLDRADGLTIPELMAAIGLAQMAHGALLRALKAREGATVGGAQAGRRQGASTADGGAAHAS